MIGHVEAYAEVMFGRNVAQWTVTAIYSTLFAVSSGAGVAYAATTGVVPEKPGSVKLDIIAVTAISTAAVTLILGLANAFAAYRSTLERTKLEAEERRFNRTMELRVKAFEARIQLAKSGISCKIDDCPVIAEVSSPVIDESPILEDVKNPSQTEDTVDLK